jgi:hypothetical protein
MILDNPASSEFRLDIEIRDDCIRAFVEGPEDSLEISLGYWKRLFAECERNGIRKLLVEENLSEGLTAAETFTLCTELPKLATAPVRVAFVDRCADHDNLNQFGEMVASNRGLRVRVFPNIEEAERWLAEG